MSQVQRTIRVRFTGAELDKLALEGLPVTIAVDPSGVWERTFPDFLINGSLEIFMYCQGWNGSKWELEVEVQGCKAFKWSGYVDKGYGYLGARVDVEQCRDFDVVKRW